MKWIKQHWRGLVRALGLLLILSAVCFWYLWFYMMGPQRHALDRNWVRRHSTDAYWSKIKTSIHRLGWAHDDSWPAGFYGDAEFMKSVMSHTHPDDDISSCAAGHRDSALCMISNHDLGADAAAWLKWWSENKSRSQVKAGLLEYLERERAYPKKDRVGVLVFGEEVDPSGDYEFFSMLTDPRFKAAACALSIGLPALGLLLLGLSFVKRKHRDVEQTTPPR